MDNLMEENNETTVNDIKAAVISLQKEIAKIEDRLQLLVPKELEKLLIEEETQLKARFGWVMVVLTSGIVATTFLVGLAPKLGVPILWTCVFAGIHGSSISAMISALERKANGWEFNNGLKYPNAFPKDKFSLRISSFFIFRPLLGILAGMVVYHGLQTLYHRDFSEEGTDVYTLIFWSFLAGLFVKTLLDKLKDLFKNLIGK